MHIYNDAEGDASLRHQSLATITGHNMDTCEFWQQLIPQKAVTSAEVMESVYVGSLARHTIMSFPQLIYPFLYCLKIAVRVLLVKMQKLVRFSVLQTATRDGN